MKYQILFPACFLLLWTLADPAANSDSEIKVTTISDGIRLTCTPGKKIEFMKKLYDSPYKMQYSDNNTGEYMCRNEADTDGPKIYVKFRTCDNCIELDVGSIVGLVVGEVVATIAIGVAVYLSASQKRIDPVMLEKKRSDRQHLIPLEHSNRAPNDHYQPLKHKGAQKDTYDVLTNRR
ncbi:T-cell surface glycoprotein CD3 gamma chain-like [Notolabrus celidotus]|uniref:T-cell surface glycoprotein CD3 gamma chain-like n=1 Tax=Notolabrus celidotus TaxID=1203425 RepID=UPI00148F64B1|nr:T-cell surface glycoprotein CD3 gamma chain-like [Notolabrus celidotus]